MYYVEEMGTKAKYFFSIVDASNQKENTFELSLA